MGRLRDVWDAELESAAIWCRGRSGLPRLVLLVWLGAILVYLWRDPPQRGLFDWPNLFSGINLGIHELGHIVFRPLGMFMTVLGGSLLQCIAPIAGMISLRKQGDFFGAAICGGWLSTNLFGVATYAADAKARALPLVSPFSGHPLHDWNFLCKRLGVLDSCEELGFVLKLAASVVMLLSLGAGAWLVWKMMSRTPSAS